MAADAYLLEQVDKDLCSSVLRVYGWHFPSITIGFHQKVDRAVNINELGDTPVARRITGGRALYHDSGEITYAMAGNFERYPELGKSLHESYMKIADILVGFYGKLDWPAQISPRPDTIGNKPGNQIQKGCFASISRYEIVAFGQKVAASAQRRTKRAFLQHGAVRFSELPPHAAISDTLARDNDGRLPKIALNRRELEKYFVGSFAEKLKIVFKNMPFDESEKQTIRDLTSRFKI